MESPPEETRNLQMSSYKMESPAPSLQNGLPETLRYFPGASNWNTSGTQLEHNWNTSGTPNAEVNTTGTQLEHLPQKCKWNASGTQVEYKWDTNGTQLVHASRLTTPFENKVLQNGTRRPQSTEWIAGNSPLFSRSLQLEHKWSKTRIQLEHKWNTHCRSEHNWNTAGTPAAEVQMEHKWDTNGTQMVHASRVTTPFENKVLQNGIPTPPVYRMDCWKN